MSSVVFDTSLPEKILFLRSISSDILSPCDARKYFNDLQFSEKCPILWCKIEPFIIAWEKEIDRLQNEIFDINFKTIDSKSVKAEIEILKLKLQEKETKIEEHLSQEIEIEWIDENKINTQSYLQTSFFTNDENILNETNLQETKNIQEQEIFENIVENDENSILGKRNVEEENTIIDKIKIIKVD